MGAHRCEQLVQANEQFVSLEDAFESDLLGDDQTAPLRPRRHGIEGLAGLTGIILLALIEVLHASRSGQIGHAEAYSMVGHVGRHDHIDGWTFGRSEVPDQRHRPVAYSPARMSALVPDDLDVMASVRRSPFGHRRLDPPRNRSASSTLAISYR